MPAPTGNRNAVKTDPRTSMVFVRVTPREKAGLVRAALPRRLSDYIRERLGLEPPGATEK